MKILKNIWSQLHRFILWALLISIFWSWIYTFVGDTSRAKKVLLYVDAYAVSQRELTLRLEDEGLPEGIRMIRARAFGYDIFNDQMNGDIYLVRESVLHSALEDTPGKLTPIPLPEGMRGYEWEGQCYGLLAFDAATQQGPAMGYVQYTPLPDPEPECYYLCFDAGSLHLAQCPDAVDNAAWEVALAFLRIDD